MLKHCAVEELEALCSKPAALPLALFTEDGLLRNSSKAKRAQDLRNKWGVIFDSIEPSLINLDGGMLYICLICWVGSQASNKQYPGLWFRSRGSGWIWPADYQDAYIQKKRNFIKRPKIQAAKEMRIQPSSEIFAPIQPASNGCWTLLLIQLTTPLSQTCPPEGVIQMKTGWLSWQSLN